MESQEVFRKKMILRKFLNFSWDARGKERPHSLSGGVGGAFGMRQKGNEKKRLNIELDLNLNDILG